MTVNSFKPGDLILTLGDLKPAIFIERQGQNHSLILYKGRVIRIHNEWFRGHDETR